MRRATFWFVFVTVLLDILAIGIIGPVFPKLVIQLEGGNEASAATMLGVFGTVWAAMQFLFAPVLGALSDRVGRRSVILISCVGLGLDSVIMALAPSVGWLFAGRVLSGMGAGRARDLRGGVRLMRGWPHPERSCWPACSTVRSPPAPPEPKRIGFRTESTPDHRAQSRQRRPVPSPLASPKDRAVPTPGPRSWNGTRLSQQAVAQREPYSRACASR